MFSKARKVSKPELEPFKHNEDLPVYDDIEDEALETVLEGLGRVAEQASDRDEVTCYKLATLEKMPDQSVGRIFFAGIVLSHSVLKEAARVLKPDGSFYVLCEGQLARPLAPAAIVPKPVGAKRGPKPKAPAVAGSKYCGHCQTTKPVEEFGKNAGTLDGLQHWCKFCRKKYSAANQGRWYANRKKRLEEKKGNDDANDSN